MPDFSVSSPSSPWLRAADRDEVVTDSDIHFMPDSSEHSESIPSDFGAPIIAEIELALESGSGDFMMTDSGPGQALDKSAPHPGSFIVPSGEAGFISSTPLSPVEDGTHDAPSREIQSKKTFFDWLRS